MSSDKPSNDINNTNNEQNTSTSKINSKEKDSLKQSTDKQSNSLKSSVDDEDQPDIANTVFADPKDFSIKHPLHQKWTFWYDNPGRKASKETWSEQLKPLLTFGTIEDFWGAYNNLRPASSLSAGSNYHLFKDGIRPEWEDEANAHGGKWVVSMKRDQKQAFDRLWLLAILAIIGEQFETGAQICGCIASIRSSQSRISLWIRDGENKPVYMEVGRELKRVLKLADNQLEFTPHQASMKKTSSRSAAVISL